MSHLDDHIDKARTLLRDGHPRTALDELIEAKRLREPRQGLDVLRADCFLAMGEYAQAHESLLEELRFFPDNAVACEALKNLPGDMSREITHEDSEFEPLLAKIRPYTMLPVNRLYNLYLRAKEVCAHDIPGDFAEFGVAGGGSTAMLAAVIRNHSSRPRTVHAFDTFSGMPDPCSLDCLHTGTPADATGWGAGTCAAPTESLRTICNHLGVLDMVRINEGLFQETLPLVKQDMTTLALLHGDADWYESMRYILMTCFDTVGTGGAVILDDYGYWDGCTKAVDEFFAISRQTPELRPIKGGGGVWLRKE
ncbi:TylF/MycF/NovP-related O-methyltransferase [Pseudodesulfovibrio piezophilus]|uniref:Macrocin O-methyltransferase n=1 Tax=Pseudodesulfovibrio piezophilus (strain DSM 21447 / JCM 15486 / C1TLV30) TaxID=1322246 RepID=M1WMB3_PSEP2|nr:TylF/MycF/NovP-related O-methyltransferase [Pseudodesulfovibrio piezophilus]CCH49305.1 conserved protein of unknown function [Pseudodesulfovibrio piezophilus C1TLV30]